jgi:hypothetical protein
MILRACQSGRYRTLVLLLDDAANRWPRMITTSQRVYEVRPRKDHRGVDLISDALPFGRLWYSAPNAVINAIGYAMHRSRPHDAVIRIYDEADNMIETHKHGGDFKKLVSFARIALHFPLKRLFKR